MSTTYSTGIPQQRLHDEEFGSSPSLSVPHHSEKPESGPFSLPSSRSSSSTLAHPHHDSAARLEGGKPLVVGSNGDKEKDPLPDEFLVEWDGDDDPENPHNWSRLARWWYTIFGGILVLNATFASSAPSGVIQAIEEEMGFSREVGTLLISLFVAGYCVGPLFWGPLSENYGRRIVFIVSFVVYTGFQVGCALSKNTASILVFRFLSGCFAASPVANSGSLIGDLWDSKTRGKALSLFTVAPFAGPALGPLVSGWIFVAGASWRWLFWVCTIFAGVVLIIIVFTLPETYAPIILKRKAMRKRKETGDERWHAAIEKHTTTPLKRFEDIVAKPFLILFKEPMLLAVTVYMSFVYGCLYLLFEAYPIVFSEGHGFNAGITGLMYLPLFIGACFGALISSFYYNPQYAKLVDEYEREGKGDVPPETRLPMCVVGGVMFSIGFFWFGWTSYSSISYWSPMLAGGLLGVALVLIFLALFNYMIDTYLHESASALSANTVCRSAFGAGFPLFASQMFKALNPRWASTLLGCVAVLMIPIPLLFIRYGKVLRARSTFSPTMVDQNADEVNEA